MSIRCCWRNKIIRKHHKDSDISLLILKKMISMSVGRLFVLRCIIWMHLLKDYDVMKNNLRDAVSGGSVEVGHHIRDP